MSQRVLREILKRRKEKRYCNVFMIEFLVVYVVCGFVGWIIDTFYCSITSKRFVSNTYFLFFANMYGMGGLLLFVNFQYFYQPSWLQILTGTFSVVLLELVGGIFCLNVLKKRVWNYSQNSLNLSGHIDILHSFYWLILTASAKYMFNLFFMP